MVTACFRVYLCACLQLPVPLAVLMLMYRKRLLPCFKKPQSLLNGNPHMSSAVDGGHGNTRGVCGSWRVGLKSSLPLSPFSAGGLFACCNAANLQGHTATFFILHALGGAILFITDGIMVRFLSNTHVQSTCVHTTRLDNMGFVLVSRWCLPAGILRWLRLHLRRVPSSADGP